MKTSPCVSLAIACASATAHASHIQTTTLSTDHTSGIRTESATPLAAHEWTFGIRYDDNNSDRLSQEELLALREEDHEASLHSVASVRTLSLDAGYGLTRDITVGVHLPYVFRYDIVEAAHEHDEGLAAPVAARSPRASEVLEGIESLGKSEGVGDLSVYGLWRFYADVPTATSVGLIAGVKAPTGSDDETADTGETFEAEFQPGSGSWDPFAGLAWTRAAGTIALSASTMYALATEGTQDTDLGDQWTYNASAGYRLGKIDGTAWNAVVELNGGWRAREKVSGVVDPNSGGSWLLVSPGVTVSGRTWSVYASLGVPIDESLHGNQDDLGYRFLVGMQFSR
jgi:hypothetical protein